MMQAMVSCAVNGLGLALVIPCVQSLVADYHPSESRGKAFGFMFFTASCGEHLLYTHVARHLCFLCFVRFKRIEHTMSI